MADRNLRDVEVFLVDCQTTGATPVHGYLIELAWARLVPAAEVAEPLEVQSTLIPLPPGERIPRIVAQLTGLRTADLTSAEGADETTAHEDALRSSWESLRSVAAELPGPAPVPTVIHFARFEKTWLEHLRQVSDDETWPFDIVCTHEIARRILSELPRRSLRAIAGYFGHTTEQLRRSEDHIQATAVVWRHMATLLEQEHGVGSWDGLRTWLSETKAKTSKRRSYPMPRATRLAVADEPGVYRMLRSNGDVLYVGKATSLKSRVNSYFRKQRKIPDYLLEMLAQARDLDVTITASPLEAALLESDEIKARRPPYNKQLLEGERQIWFSTPEAADVSVEPSESRLWGPFRSRGAPSSLSSIATLIANFDGADDDDRHRAIGVAPQWAPNSDVFDQGFRLFHEKHRLGSAVSTRELLILGAKLFRAAQVAPPEENDDEDEERAWTAEDVAEDLEDAVRDSATLVRRGRWLCCLSDSEVVYMEPSGTRLRKLVIRDGAIEAMDADADELGPAPRTTRYDRQRVFDVATYDRLRTLTTELRRVVKDGGRARVRFFNTAVLQGPSLYRVLSWV